MPPSICKNAGICKQITVLFLMCEMQGYASKSQCPSWCAKCRDTHNVFRLQTQCSPRCAKRSEVLCSLSIAVMFSLYENGSVVYAITVFLHANRSFCKKTHCSSPIFNMQGYIGHSQWPLLCGIPAFSIWKSQFSPTAFPPKSQCSPLYIYNHKYAPPLEGANPLSENHAPVINALHSLSNGFYWPP